MSFQKDMEQVENNMRPVLKELHRNLSKPLITEICPEHWHNIVIFGQCWRHNEDGSLKSTFTKRA